MTSPKPNADRIAFLLNQRKGLQEDLRLTPLGHAHNALASEVEQINHSLWLAGYAFDVEPTAKPLSEIDWSAYRDEHLSTEALRAALYGED